MRCLFVFFLFLLQGCTLYPEFEPEISDMPLEWRIPTQEMRNDIGWWNSLGDPILTLLIKDAMQHNQDLLAAIARVEEYAARWEMAKSELYPQINMNGDANRQKISSSRDPIQEGTAEKFNAFDLQLNVSYLVDIWGKIRSESKAAQEELFSQMETKKSILLTVITSVATQYIVLRQFDLQHQIAVSTEKSREESYFLAKTRFDLGLTSQIEVDQALSEIESAQVEVKRLERSIAITEDLLSFLVGRPSFSIPRGCMIDQMKTPPSLPSYLPSEVVAQRPDILAQERKLLAANARIGVARARFFPEFSLSGNFGTQSSKLSKFLRASSLIWGGKNGGLPCAKTSGTRPSSPASPIMP